MCNKWIFISALALGSVCSAANGVDVDFLREKPTFLLTCQRKSPDFSKCIANAFQHIFSSWKDGVQGVPHSKPIDPLWITKFNVVEDSASSTPISVKIHNITSIGISEANVTNVSFKDSAYDFKMTYFVPKIRMSGQYTARGQVILLNIDSKGDMFMEYVNGLYTIATKIKLREQKNVKFFDLKALQFHVVSLEDVRLHFYNLFKDQTLSDNTNAVFQENWRMFFDIFKPEIEREINKVLLMHFRSVFSTVPAEFFIADVATEN